MSSDLKKITLYILGYLIFHIILATSLSNCMKSTGILLKLLWLCGDQVGRLCIITILSLLIHEYDFTIIFFKFP